MSKTHKRLLSWVLSVIMMISVIPMPVSYADTITVLNSSEQKASDIDTEDELTAALANGGEVVASVNYVAEVDGVGYESFAEALAAASGKTITLLADTTFAGGSIVGEVVLDLNGKTLTTTVENVFTISGAKLTVKDSSAEKTGKIDGSTIATNDGNMFLVYEGGELVIESGIIHSKNNVVFTYYGNNKVTVNGGELKSIISSGNVFYLCGEQTAIVNGGTILGGVFVYTGNFSVTGGRFTTDVNSYCAAGYGAVMGADGMYEVVAVTASNAAAQIGDNYYLTLGAAINAAGANDTIIVLKDVTEELPSLKGKLVPASGKTVTITATNSGWYYLGNAFEVGEGVTLNIPNGDLFVYYTDGAVIRGDVTARGLYIRYAGTKLTVYEPGSLTITSEKFYIRDVEGDTTAGIYIVGDNNDDTVGLRASVVYFYQGMFNAKDANVVVGVFWQTQGTDADAFANAGSANLVLDNTLMDVTVNEHNFLATGNSSVTLTNGSILTIAKDYEGALPSIDSTSSIIVNGKNYFVASVNGTQYKTLQEAINAASGKTITLLADIELTEAIVIPADYTVILDLNGKTISQTKAQTGAYSMIVNNGNLTIQDSVGTGKISYTDSGNGGEYVSNTIVNNGTLTVKGGTIENISNEVVADNGYPHAIDTNGTLVIEGGVITSANYSAIRIWCTTDETEVTISGGTINGAVDLHNVNGKDNQGTLTVTGGTFNKNASAANIRVLAFGADLDDFVATITGGTFDSNVIIRNFVGGDLNSNVYKVSGGTFGEAIPEVFCADGYIPKDNGDGTYGVKVGKYVASVDGVKYESLQEAIDAANGKTVTLLADVELTEALAVPAGLTVTLDLNGHKIIGIPAAAEAYSVIINKGDLTINDSVGNGAIICDHKLTGSTGYAVNTITNSGKLTVNGGTIENKSTSTNQIGYAIDNNSTSANAVVVINGGKITASGSYYYDGIRQFCNSVTNENSVNVNGGYVSSLWLQNPSDGSSDRNTKDVKGSVVITGGEIGSVYTEPSSGFTAAITGGTIGAVASFESSEGRDLTGFISGGTFKAPVLEAHCAKGYVPVDNGDGTYGVKVGLRGAGTETDPYIIGSVSDLILFRDSVNAGETTYNASGVYVALDADIDLADIDWSVNIGDDCNATFDGIFDGKNHTIKNLTSTETAQKSDGYICTGLFGAIYGDAVVKNLVIENVTINTGNFTGNNVAAVVGFAYNATGSVENVTVKGDIQINANKVDGVGVIVGYAYGGKLTVKNCVVDGAAVTRSASAVNGQAYVGGIIGYAGGKATLNNNTVKNIAINASSCAAGGVAGIILGGGVASGNTVKNVTLTSAHENWKNAVGAVAGTFTGSITVSGTVAENNSTEALVGVLHANKPTAPLPKAQAKIGDVYYGTLADAIAAAQDGDTIELLANIELTDTLIIDKSGTVVIDGNGKTVTLADSFTNTNSWGAAIMIGNSNYGDADAANRTVTIKNMTFEGITGNSVIRAQGVTLNMEGCTVTNCNSTNTVQGMIRIDYTVANIKDTVFTGNKAAKIIGHNHNAGGSKSKLTVEGCAFNGNTINGNGVIVLSSDAGCTIKNSSFIGNNTTCTNGATVYMGFTENNVITGNLFKDNVVNGNATSNRIAGALFVGYENEISGNAFVNNTATNASGSAANDVCIDTIYALPAYGYDLVIDISDNYFDGVKPVEGDHYIVNSKVGTAYALDSYYTGYTVNENGVVLNDKVEIVYVAEVNGVKYESFADALAAAKAGDTVKLLADITANATLYQGITLDLNGHTLTSDLYFVATVGNHVIDSTNSTGMLKVPSQVSVVLPQNNKQLAVWDATNGGYVFTDVDFYQSVDYDTEKDKVSYKFAALFDNMKAVELLANGTADNKLSLQVRMSWEDGYQYFVYSEDTISDVYNNLLSGNRYRFTFSVGNTKTVAEQSFNVQAQFISGTGAIMGGNTLSGWDAYAWQADAAQ